MKSQIVSDHSYACIGRQQPFYRIDFPFRTNDRFFYQDVPIAFDDLLQEPEMSGGGIGNQEKIYRLSHKFIEIGKFHESELIASPLFPVKENIF